MAWSFADCPVFGVAGHVGEHGEDFFVLLVETDGVGRIYVTEPAAQFEAGLDFSGLAFGIVQLADEGGGVAAFAPGFRGIRRDRL
jgi:hypothetical protein